MSAKRRCGGGLLLALLLALSVCAGAGANHGLYDLNSIGPTGGNGDFGVGYGGISQDGSRLFFMTREPLVAADTDAALDVYQRFGGTTTLISTGTTGGNGAFDAIFMGSSADGSRVWFETNEPMTSGDTDGMKDVYERFNNATTLVSTGPTGGNANQEAFWVGASQDGLRVFFQAYEPLVAADSDQNRKDVYQRFGGTTTLISTSPTDNHGPVGADWWGNSADGTRVLFDTDGSLAASDTDNQRDVYVRVNGTTTDHVSTGPAGGNGNARAFPRTISPDGTHVFFETTEQLVTTDTDAFRDVYDRSGGVTSLVSVSASGGNGPYDASFRGTAVNGSKVWFVTREPMVPDDVDDFCEDTVGNPTIRCTDVYERSGGTTTWVSSGGSGSHLASFSGNSQDGSRVFFVTTESLVPQDLDTQGDVYERFGGVNRLVSTGPTGGNGPHGADFAAVSQDGLRVFFLTFESLTPTDSDVDGYDAYERFNNETTLVSTSLTGGTSASSTIFAGASVEGTRIFFETTDQLTSADTDNQTDLYSATVPGGYPRPQGAAALRIPLAVAYAECTSGNRTHGPGLVHPSCNPAVAESPNLTVGTTDANGFSPQFVGSWKLTVCPNGTTATGTCATPSGMSAPDVRVNLGITDVRCRTGSPTQGGCQGGAFSDYTGELRVTAEARITDKHNSTTPGGSGDSATVSDIPLPFATTVGCVANPAGATANTIGANCDVTTSANTILPGFMPAAKRGNWQIGQVDVVDGGPDGVVSTGDNARFLTQGLFVP